MAGAGPEPALSIVVPVYNEEGNVGPLHAELAAVARNIGRPYEIVFVNDGSRDQTLERLVAIEDPALRIVDLDGNFGEAAAISAGFNAARGAVVVTLDGDGQNDPGDIPKLLAALDRGHDAVSGRRLGRKEAFFSRVLPSRVANRLIVLATGVPVYDCGCGLKAYRRELVTGTQLPRGMNRFLPALLGVDPMRVTEIATQDRPRGSGASHYGFSRTFVVLRDLLSLPLLVRGGPVGRGHVRVLECAVVLLVAAAIVLAGRSLAAALVALLAAGAAAAIRHNANRVVQAREQGVFRVRRVLHANVNEDRHRGSGVLGHEPAPDLRARAGGAGH
jgi:glycosyltransferase involved in cell wall biosynthesis